MKKKTQLIRLFTVEPQHISKPMVLVLLPETHWKVNPVGIAFQLVSLLIRKQMEFIQTYKNKRSLTHFMTSVYDSLSAYVNRHAGEFEALARTGSPYGGNWMPGRYAAIAKPTSTDQEPISHLKQRVAELTSTVNQLNQEIQSIKSADQPMRSPNGKVSARETGIQRFRALRARAC